MYSMFKPDPFILAIEFKKKSNSNNYDKICSTSCGTKKAFLLEKDRLVLN